MAADQDLINSNMEVCNEHDQEVYWDHYVRGYHTGRVFMACGLMPVTYLQAVAMRGYIDGTAAMLMGDELAPRDVLWKWSDASRDNEYLDMFEHELAARRKKISQILSKPYVFSKFNEFMRELCGAQISRELIVFGEFSKTAHKCNSIYAFMAAALARLRSERVPNKIDSILSVGKIEPVLMEDCSDFPWDRFRIFSVTSNVGSLAAACMRRNANLVVASVALKRSFADVVANRACEGTVLIEQLLNRLIERIFEIAYGRSDALTDLNHALGLPNSER